MLTRAGLKKKRTAVIVLWVIYAIAAGAFLFFLAQGKTADQAKKNLFAQAEAVAEQIPALLENAFYCEIASRKMKTAKLDGLVFALDDTKDIEEQRALLDDFAEQADVTGVVVHDRNGSRIYASKEAKKWDADEQYLMHYSDQYEERLYEIIRSEPKYLRNHYFSSNNIIDTGNPEEDPDENLEENELPDEDTSDLMTQYVSRLTSHGRWVVITGNAPGEEAQAATMLFDWRTVLGKVWYRLPSRLA